MTPTTRLTISTLVVATATAAMAALPYVARLGGPSVDDGFVIDGFDRHVRVGADGRVDVVETIDVTFIEERRGILRDLDTEGLGGAPADPEVHGVDQGTDGTPWPYALEDEGDVLRVRIGDANLVLAPGPQTYRLRYRAGGQVASDLEDPGTAELRIDIPGDRWPVTVATTTVTVELPAEPEGVVCVYGARGATTACPPATVQGTTVSQTIPTLDPATTGTLSVRLPSSAFDGGALPAASFTALDAGDGADPDEAAPLDLPEPARGLLLGLLAAAPVVGFELLRGRFVYRDQVTDPVLHHRVTPTAELAPPDRLVPNELATVLQRVGDAGDRFLSTLIHLELRGVLRSVTTVEDGQPADPSRVTDGGGDLKADRIVLEVGPDPERASDVERRFVAALLGDTGSIVFDGDYDEDVSKRTTLAMKVLDDRAAELRRPGAGIVHDRSSVLRGGSGVLLGLLALGASFGLAVVATWLIGLPWTFAFAALGVVVLAWIALVPVWRYHRQAFTSYGRDLSARTRAFRHFLAEVHRDRLAIDAELGTPLQHPIVTMLPYAVALGLGRSWYERFAPVLAELSATDPTAGTAGTTAVGGGVPWWGYAGGFAGFQAAQGGSTTDPSSSSSGGGSVGGGAGSGAGGGGGGSW